MTKLTIGNATIYSGNNLDILPTLPDNSVDSIVTDPPYELGFMGKSWDSSGIAYSVELWRECLRVLKPGGHLLAFGGTRTWHRLAVAIEDAGFEIRDNIAWLYGSGFPKSHNISKAIDKLHGAERKVIGKSNRVIGVSQSGINGIGTFKEINWQESNLVTAPTTDDAKLWDGWGTALKPAHEPIVVARKPVIGTVAENVLAWGVGGLNIDATRIGTTDKFGGGAKGSSGFAANYDAEGWTEGNSLGRWPANIILDETTAELLDKQSGISKSPPTYTRKADGFGKTSYGIGEAAGKVSINFGDSGGASRFFYVAKASKRDRNEGLDELPEQQATEMTGRADGSLGLLRIREDGSIGENPYAGKSGASKNFHPTVKPTTLMQYLIRLVTPENGLVLDPFCGSGSTGKAAILENKHFIGIELTEEYLPIIAGRLQHATDTINNKQEDLFDQIP